MSDNDRMPPRYGFDVNGYARQMYDGYWTPWHIAKDEIAALRAALDQEREKVRALAESTPMATLSLCCGILRKGWHAPLTVHSGLCRERHGGELGKTYYLHDVSALLSGRGEVSDE